MGNPVEALLAPKFSGILPVAEKSTQPKRLPAPDNQFKFRQKYSAEYIQNLKVKSERVNSFSNKLKNVFGCGETLTEQEKNILATHRQPAVPQLMPKDTNQPE